MGYLAIDLSATADLPLPSALRGPARRLRTAGSSFREAVVDAAAKWQALDGLYETPEKHLVFSALDSPAKQAGLLETATGAVTDTLLSFAETVETIRSGRAQLQTDIAAADAGLAALMSSPGEQGSGRFEHELQEYHWAFSDRAKALAADYTSARETCLAALRSVGRSSSDVSSFYASGTLDLLSNDAEQLHRQAISPGATALDVRRYFDFLAEMEPEGYREFAGDYPEAAVYPPRLGLDAAAGDRFWESLTLEQQEAIAAALPAVVGNTEGVPYAVRAAANAAVLALVLKPSWPATQAQRSAYENIRGSLRGTDQRSGPLSLISFDPSEPPLAAVAMGDMDRASNITVNVSGMGSTTQEMESAVQAAEQLFREQRKFTSDHAVVAWIGYESPAMPPSTQVLFSDHARVGGGRLANVIDGLYLTRGTENTPYVSVTAHSYGTTTAAFALTETTHPIDSVVFYGSAGIDPEAAASAADLHVKEGGVFATQGQADLVAPGGIFGSNLGDPRLSPTAASWGANVFDSEEQAGLRGNGGHGMQGTDKSASPITTETGGGYLDRNTASLNQIAAASTGRAGDLTLIRQSKTDDLVESITNRASAVYNAPGAAVDAAQRVSDGVVNSAQSVADVVDDSMQAGAMRVADAWQEANIRDFGPFENPLNPAFDGLQEGAADVLDAAQRVRNTAVDFSQSTVESIVDLHQKAADDYFRKQWNKLRFVAGKLVEVARTD